MNTSDLTTVFTPFPILETPRLVLREIRAEDKPALLALWGDPLVARYLDGPVLQTLDEVQEIVDWAVGIRERGHGIRWAITLKDEDPVIGTCGYHIWQRGNSRVETGYDLASAYWRQGIMREALRAMFAFGFEKMALHRIEAMVDPRNEASLGLLANLGFTREGTLRERNFYNDAFHTAAIFGLLKGEFSAE